MDNDKLNHLIAKYLAGQCTSQEKREVENWYDQYNAGNKKYLNDDAAEMQASAERSFEELSERLSLSTENAQHKIRPINKISRVWWAAAAVIVMCAISGYFLSLNNTMQQLTEQHQHAPITPGTNKAFLTLSGGKQVNLTDADSGTLAKAGGINITKSANGELIYSSARQQMAGKTEKVEYNTLTTPRGGQFQVVLPDGSRVWLNSASSIIYPTAFTGETRVVKLQGEAYFEVAKNKNKPFIVKANNVDVKVLGTHFDVTAYSDDAAITTTLLEGSVRLKKGEFNTLLTPGLQGIAMNNQKNITTQKANIEQVMAWKNGYFIFDDLSVKEVMKTVSRWYDVEISYRGNLENKKFGGTISRYKNITELLDNMSESGGIHYQIKGRRILLIN